MTLIVATLLIFAAGPFVLWPLIKTPDETADASQSPREHAKPGPQ